MAYLAILCGLLLSQGSSAVPVRDEFNATATAVDPDPEPAAEPVSTVPPGVSAAADALTADPLPTGSADENLPSADKIVKQPRIETGSINNGTQDADASLVSNEEIDLITDGRDLISESSAVSSKDNATAGIRLSGIPPLSPLPAPGGPESPDISNVHASNISNLDLPSFPGLSDLLGLPNQPAAPAVAMLEPRSLPGTSI
jgi:hypothetical protein